MFSSSSIVIQQPDSSANPPSLRLTFMRPHVIPLPDFDDEDQTVGWVTELMDHPWMGAWRLGANSRTDSVDDTYSVGTSVPQRSKFWRWSIRGGGAGEIYFVEGTQEIGGGLKYGQQAAVENRILTLRNAWLSKDGIQPFGSDEGVAEVHIPSNILKRGVRTVWQSYY
ncbi:MAG TPA: hypothetical protein VHM91_09125 [Verrucomicrobiales bacterium]|nr:hypothetical protein [Verrucomicrobiales bacterium]